MNERMTFSGTLSIAPMLDYTDRHFRYLMRLITTQTLLYTEMYCVQEILGTKERDVLTLNPIESPVALQLGGSQPILLEQCTRLAEQAGYDEINLNVGCPSQRVQRGKIGACLMLEPALVAECVTAMQSATSKPVTVKCRLGVNDHDSYEQLAAFIEKVSQAGCNSFIIHSRKAILGLNPKQNRTIPPLDYPKTYRLKQDFPHLRIILNGGVKSFEEAIKHLREVDGVMMGRSAYSDPMLFSIADTLFYGNAPPTFSENEVLKSYLDYIEKQLSEGQKLTVLSRHLVNFFRGKAGARECRASISKHSHCQGGGLEAIRQAILTLLPLLQEKGA